ncbi:TPA: hypothetical protein N0F65_005200 [Lagenidium giganteum]|uniref:BCCIP family protein n=1 Tax=Lagenidium giganteum TaxID=4803 RepID=A0AAV2Z167_9STRA|nr:TPA: hypothetical protein N0F65_005200 [Lagenidium giganteum]
MQVSEESSDSDSDDDDALTFNERMDDSDCDDDDDDDESDAEKKAGKADRLVNVDFVFNDPSEDHFHSVKQFLVSYMPASMPFDVSGLANIIVNQVSTGTMVCVEGEPGAYGFITALSLSRYKNETSIQQILQYVTKRCPADQLAQFQKFLDTKSVALIVNERMINLPYQLVPALHSALHEDIEWAIENEETEELRKSFKFDYFLILSTCTLEMVSTTSGSNGKGKGKKSKSEATFFQNFEDEFIKQDAELTFTFEMPRSDRDRSETARKTTDVMLVPRSKHKAAVSNFAAMINM